MRSRNSSSTSRPAAAGLVTPSYRRTTAYIADLLVRDWSTVGLKLLPVKTFYRGLAGLARARGGRWKPEIEAKPGSELRIGVEPCTDSGPGAAEMLPTSFLDLADHGRCGRPRGGG